MSRVYTWVALLALVGMVVAGCAAPAQPTPAPAQPTQAPTAAPAQPTQAPAQPTQPPAAAEKVLKIGASLALTGAVSKEGTNVRDGIVFWRDFVNERGGVDIGGEKYRVEVVFYDDKSDAETGAKLTEKLITEDKVDFIFGPFSSAITMNTSVIGEKYKVITIAPQANSDAIYERGFKYIFSVMPPASTYLRRVIDMALAQEPKPKTVAVLIRDDPFGIAAGEGAANYAKEKGLEVVYKEKFPKDTKDVSSLLTQVKALNPDLMLASTLFQDAVLITKQAKDLKVCPKLMAFTAGPAIPDFLKELGADAEYIYGSEWWLPILSWKDPYMGTPQEVADAFEKKFGYRPGYHAASGIAAGRILQEALRIAGTKDTEAVRKALLEHGPGDIFWGPTGWNEQGKNIKGASVPIQIQNGKVVAVWPPEVAQAKPIYPMPCWDAR